MMPGRSPRRPPRGRSWFHSVLRFLERSPHEPYTGAADVVVVRDVAGLAWTCMVCGKERPDDAISVRSMSSVTSHNIEVSVNVRFCNDDVECATQAGFIAGEMLRTFL